VLDCHELLTGEVPWVIRNVQKHNAAAQSKGVKIVHCCGYDSVPSDLGTLMVADHCWQVLKQPVARVSAWG
jgi:short subunit dehydrogenase-like uncharacterized protein